MSHPAQFKHIVLDSRPVGDIESNTFRTEIIPFSSLKLDNDESLVQCTWLSLDPAMRGFIRDVRSYLPPVKIGEVMRASGLGVVIKTGPDSKFKVGDHVSGAWGMTEFAVMEDKSLRKILVPPGIQPLDFLNILGSPGMTAYFGLKKIGDLKPGDKLVVSGAAGAVGSITCQLGKAAAAKVYGIAGSEAKCRWLEEDLGVEIAFNYKSPTFFSDFKKKVGYLDVYFDNVGGEILDFMLSRLNKGARIILCGAISTYNSPKPKGLQGYLSLISQRAKIQGFVVFDYEKEYPSAIKELSKQLKEGAIKSKFHIVEGIEQAPMALPMLFTGGNTGKLVVKVSPEPSVARSKL